MMEPPIGFGRNRLDGSMGSAATQIIIDRNGLRKMGSVATQDIGTITGWINRMITSQIGFSDRTKSVERNRLNGSSDELKSVGRNQSDGPIAGSIGRA